MPTESPAHCHPWVHVNMNTSHGGWQASKRHRHTLSPLLTEAVLCNLPTLHFFHLKWMGTRGSCLCSLQIEEAWSRENARHCLCKGRGVGSKLPGAACLELRNTPCITEHVRTAAHTKLLLVTQIFVAYNSMGKPGTKKKICQTSISFCFNWTYNWYPKEITQALSFIQAIWHRAANRTIGCYNSMPAQVVMQPLSILLLSSSSPPAEL